jgi:putative membrane protein
MGLGFVIRVFAFAIVIEITDKISSGFTTDGFWPSLWLAIILAIVGAALDGILF